MQQNTRCIAHRLGPPGGLATSVAPDPDLCHRWRFLKVSKHASAAQHTLLTGLAGWHHLTQLDLAYVTLTDRATLKCQNKQSHFPYRLGSLGGLAPPDAAGPGLCQKWRFLKVTKCPSAAKHTLLTGLAHLEGLHHLTQLDLAYVSLTDGGVSSLQRLTSLVDLNLDNSNLTDRWACHTTDLHLCTHMYLWSRGEVL